ncbi:helix-turn-helix domain-containing protein [Tenacibaculum sp. UWU-22]|uniref:helix-turn-helix domain-containing protein n=1 Tax=Tenacibaculum sp. UWU-22 TaxID=3234187 RepID=UPI0034DB3D84
MKKLGYELRRIRESKNILLRQVAYVLDIDTAMMSKIERGERNIQREQVQKIADFYKISEEKLLILWVHDKLLNAVENEPFALKGMQKALKSLKI